MVIIVHQILFNAKMEGWLVKEQARCTHMFSPSLSEVSSALEVDDKSLGRRNNNVDDIAKNVHIIRQARFCCLAAVVVVVACVETVWPQSGAQSCDLLTRRICTTPAATNSHGLYFF